MSVNCAPSYGVTGYKSRTQERSLLSHVTASSTTQKRLLPRHRNPSARIGLRPFPRFHKVLPKLRIK